MGLYPLIEINPRRAVSSSNGKSLSLISAGVSPLIVVPAVIPNFSRIFHISAWLVLLGQNIVSFFIVGKLIVSVLEHTACLVKCGRLERKCRHWTHYITVKLEAVADVTIAKAHAPSAAAVVLSNTPVVAIHAEGIAVSKL